MLIGSKDIKRRPAKTKFRNYYRSTLKYYKNLRTRKNIFIHASLSFKALSACFLTWKVSTELMKNLRKFKTSNIRIFTTYTFSWPISHKKKGVRMGKGKGKTQDNSWVARIPAAKILFAFRMRKKKLVSYAENKLKTTANLLPIRSSVIRERLLLEQKKMFSKN